MSRVHMERARFCLALVICATAAACSSGARDENDPLAASETTTGAAGDDESGDPLDQYLDVGDGELPPAGDGGGGGCNTPPIGGDATLTGTVYAPNGELPLSGALVWVSPSTPEPIPDHVYCLDCVELPCEQPHAFTEPDGSFSLSLPSGTHSLVVQKGQFRRVTEVEVGPGPSSLAAEVTTLPGRSDPDEGLFIPRIALGLGSYDRLEDALAKLGLADTVADGEGERFAPGTQAFDIYSNTEDAAIPAQSESLGTFTELLADYDRMAQYHIIFVPCTSSPDRAALSDPAVQDNIRRWVEEGGKWYVADWSNEYIETPFPQYQTWYEDAWAGGIDLDEYDSLATILDDDLLAWLGALPAELKNINPNSAEGPHPTLDGLPKMQLVDLWSTPKETLEVWVDDGAGGQVNVGHKTWLQGPGGGGDGAPSNQEHPLAMTAEYGCGKIMFTSYHTVEWSGSYDGLTPQELVLMYLILEIGVCQTPYAPPPVP